MTQQPPELDHAPLLRRLLDEHPGLHVDLSWSAVDHLDRRPDQVEEQWVALVEEHADRFVVGSDVAGHFHGLDGALARLTPFLEKLSDGTRAKVAGGNAERLWFGTAQSA